MEGYSHTISMIFRFDFLDGESATYRVKAQADSYGDKTWGALEEVTPYRHLVMSYRTPAEHEEQYARDKEDTLTEWENSLNAAVAQDARNERGTESVSVDLPVLLDSATIAERMLNTLIGETEEDAYTWGWTEWKWEGKNIRVPNLGIVNVEEESGGEGEGNHAEIIFKIIFDDAVCTEKEAYYRKTGSYMSHYGYGWDGDFTRVKPGKKVVVDYVEIND
jgi:hypothetical protein